MNIKAFMKAELKDRGTMEFPGIETFKDEKGQPIPFIIKRLSMKEMKDIRDLYKTTEVYREGGRNGRPVIGNNGVVAVIKDYDAEKAGQHMMVEAFVQPKLDDPELMEFYGILDRLDMPHVIFSTKEDFEYANQCLSDALGLGSKDEKETIEELKN